MTETKIMGSSLTILAGIVALIVGFEYSGQWQQRWVDLSIITGIIAIPVGICWLATTIRDYLAYEASLVLLHDLITKTRHIASTYQMWAKNGEPHARGAASGATYVLKCLEGYEASLLAHRKLPASFHYSELKLLAEKEPR